MSKRVFDEIKAGIEDGIAFAKGDKSRGVEHIVRVPDQVDVRAIRTGLGLTQRRFADRFGFDPRTVQDWEQGRQKPERTARILMMVIQNQPDAVREALIVENAMISTAGLKTVKTPVSVTKQSRTSAAPSTLKATGRPS